MAEQLSRWEPTPEDYALRDSLLRQSQSPRLEVPASQIQKENAHLARVSTEAPRIPWDEFIRNLRWRQGEHFTLIGPTGQGKTTMLTHLLPRHPFVTVFATKPRDETMSNLIRSGYLKIERWRSLDPDIYPRRVLWPDATKLGADEHQRIVFEEALEKIFREGGWTVAFDELWYMVEVLKLERQVKLYLQQSRSLKISLIVASRRPAWIPVEVYDQSTHLMFWRDNDERNLRRISGISYRSVDLVRQLVADLEAYQVLYINTRTGDMLRTRCPNTRFTGGR